MKIKLLFLLLSVSSVVFSQYSIKMGLGGMYVPTLSQVNYPFRQEAAVAGIITGEVETFFPKTKFGLGVKSSFSSLKTTEIGLSLKLTNSAWHKTRRYTFEFYTGLFNKEGESIVLFGVGAEIKLSALIGKTINELENMQLGVLLLLPDSMFKDFKLANDAMAKLTLSFPLINF